MNNYNLERFLKAQEKDYELALKEICNGHKESHWIWYIFPQLKDLGYSSNAKYYGIADLTEAKAYLANDILNRRLREISLELLKLDDDIKKIVGEIDAYKIKSSMTLFAKASEDNQIFLDVLAKFYNSEYDEKTLNILKNNL